MARSTKAKTKTNTTSEAMSNVYATKEVLVSTLTTNVLEALTETDVKVNETTSKKIYNSVNQTVTIQIDSLVNRLMRVLD